MGDRFNITGLEKPEYLAALPANQLFHHNILREISKENCTALHAWNPTESLTIPDHSCAAPPIQSEQVQFPMPNLVLFCAAGHE